MRIKKDASTIPRELIKQIETGNCILFMGSGCSVEAGGPTSQELANELANEYLEGKQFDKPLPEVASLIEQTPGAGRIALIQFIIQKLSRLSPTEAHLELAKYPWKAIFTTNYDELVELSYAEIHKHKRRIFKILKSSDFAIKTDANESVGTIIVKPHGCISQSTSSETPLVISEEDYRIARDNRMAIYRYLESFCYSSTLLFAGYSLNDSNFMQVWDSVVRELDRLALWAYAIWPNHTQEQLIFWEKRKIRLIDLSFKGFFKQLKGLTVSSVVQANLTVPLTSVINILSEIADSLALRDPYFYEHLEQVAGLALQLGARMGLSEKELFEIETSALLHDIGKLAVQDKILLKPGPLTPMERVEMERHPLIGEQWVTKIPGLESIARIIGSEHEKYDGTGFPDGLAGDEIPLCSRILATCDIFWALTTDRPYRKAYSREKALTFIVDMSGSHLDPKIVSEFLLLMEGESFQTTET